VTVCVGPDSGPGHLAAVVRTPYLSLFGPTDPGRTAPYGSEDLVIRSPIGCAPCYRRRCPGLGTLCMRLLGVESVWGRLLPFLA
jgi:ADP-heptose:LPS heptosyltransferase